MEGKLDHLGPQVRERQRPERHLQEVVEQLEVEEVRARVDVREGVQLAGGRGVGREGPGGEVGGRERLRGREGAPLAALLAVATRGILVALPFGFNTVILRGCAEGICGCMVRAGV